MPDNPISRRLLTVPSVLATFLVLTGLSPLLALVGLTIDVLRSMTRGKPFMTLRVLTFAWVYLLGQILSLLGLLVTTPLPRVVKREATFALQRWWTSWNFAWLRIIFSLGLEVEGQASATPGPILLLARHASMVDTMLPAHLIANPSGLRLRYVLKKELLADPTLDIGGNRLPNHFINRGAGDSAKEVEAVRRLASELGDEEGILIYPEGTRYSEDKRVRYTEQLARRGGPVSDLAASYRRVLPPRPGGTLALLDATDADVVILAHSGLEGLATARDIWSGGMVGSTIRVALWRIPRSAVPEGRKAQLAWLYEVWSKVDDWIVAQHDDSKPSSR